MAPIVDERVDMAAHMVPDSYRPMPPRHSLDPHTHSLALRARRSAIGMDARVAWEANGEPNGEAGEWPRRISDVFCSAF